MSPRQLLCSPVALRHLDELWDYIAKANAPAAADRYLETIFDYCDGLVAFPFRGTARDDLRPGLRTISFPPTRCGASDGFIMRFDLLPSGVDDFVRLVIPELQHRGLYRTEYRGKTLRDHLGLPVPQSQFAPLSS